MDYIVALGAFLFLPIVLGLPAVIARLLLRFFGKVQFNPDRPIVKFLARLPR